MSFQTKTDYIGLARTGLEVVANSDNATNQTLDVVSRTGDVKKTIVFGEVKAPHVDYKITGDVDFTGENKLTVGKVYGEGPYALSGVSIHTGAGEEPTFGADSVQIQAGAENTRCVYDLSISGVTPDRHAQDFGAFTFEETDDAVLQSTDYNGAATIDPTTISGVPKVADAVMGKETVSVTILSSSDTVAPSVTPAEGWTITGVPACTGSDGALFSWSLTLTKNLTKAQ